ncbi:hypothetical protein HPB52_022797 [Rhipicephalus sanguineus]|uniref:HTH psq-type domain-containing protein n=1 Tax=Rhipicephalus sanguineus TaxID=34632 RepID=A0A9D4QFK7_RHISA|nr:hypothetical protein HPB52_022797 [Rhipicephalus sanguineus]
MHCGDATNVTKTCFGAPPRRGATVASNVVSVGAGAVAGCLEWRLSDRLRPREGQHEAVFVRRSEGYSPEEAMRKPWERNLHRADKALDDTSADAVPTILPNLASYLTKKAPRERPTRKRKQSGSVQGEKETEVAKKFNIPKSTLLRILKNKDTIEGAVKNGTFSSSGCGCGRRLTKN